MGSHRIFYVRHCGIKGQLDDDESRSLSNRLLVHTAQTYLQRQGGVPTCKLDHID